MQPDEIARPIYSGWLVPWIRYCVSLPPEYKYSPRAPIGFCGPPGTKAGKGPSRACSPAVGVQEGHSSFRPTVAGPRQAFPPFAAGDAVADRLALRQDVIKKSATGIDDDRAGGFVARVLDDVTPILLRNDRLPVGQIGHQLLVTRTPASLCRRRQCPPLHAAAEHQGDNCKDNRTHGCNFPLFREPQARCMRAGRTCSTVVVRGTTHPSNSMFR